MYSLGHTELLNLNIRHFLLIDGCIRFMHHAFFVDSVTIWTMVNSIWNLVIAIAFVSRRKYVKSCGNKIVAIWPVKWQMSKLFLTFMLYMAINTDKKFYLFARLRLMIESSRISTFTLLGLVNELKTVVTLITRGRRNLLQL